MRRSLRWLLALSLIAAATAAGAQQPQRAVRPRTLAEDLQMFTGVLNQIRVNHPDSVDTHELIMAAIQGMVNAADPHSYVITSVRFSPEKEKALRDGKLYPVPIDFQYIEGVPVVQSVTPGSTAARAGVLPGDVLVAAEGKPVLAQSAFELSVELAGEKKSHVRLGFERRRSDGTLAQVEMSVRREKPDEATAVPVAFMLDRETGYTRITGFDNLKVADDFHDALGRLEKQGMKRLVLDLRDNPGGITTEAAHVAGEFLPKGAIVYTQIGRKLEISKDTARVERSFFNREKRYPIVVLINKGSASAAELVAGALQDHDRALIAGRPSFGKSLLMTGTLLPDGSQMVLVVGRLRTPCGRVIQRQYRGLQARDYYRRAGVAGDTVGRPSCKTDAGRTVYGGGGIYPDVVFPEPEPTPVWLSRVLEKHLPLTWLAGHMSASGSAYTTADALAARPVLAGTGLADFRKLAADQGVAIPEGAEADRRLQYLLLPLVADAKWGPEGLYKVVALLDPEVQLGIGAFSKAVDILAASR